MQGLGLESRLGVREPRRGASRKAKEQPETPSVERDTDPGVSGLHVTESCRHSEVSTQSDCPLGSLAARATKVITRQFEWTVQDQARERVIRSGGEE